MASMKDAATDVHIKRLWQKVRRFRWLFALCPFVRMVAVCNSLARGNPKATSDIDLFIVTSSNRLWMTRFFLKCLTQLFCMRVHHTKVAGRFCLSFFVDETRLNLEKHALPHDPELASIIESAVPLIGHEVYLEWRRANVWTRRYFPQHHFSELQKSFARLSLPMSLFNGVRLLFELILWPFAAFMERFFYWLQRKKDIRRSLSVVKKEGVIIEPHIFKFHENDTRAECAKLFPS